MAISPWIEPTKENMATNKTTMVKMRKRTHLLDQGAIFFCTKYISTGKYTTKGQKVTDPANATTSLKKGNNIAQISKQITTIFATNYVIWRYLNVTLSLKVHTETPLFLIGTESHFGIPWKLEQILSSYEDQKESYTQVLGF